MTAVSGSDADGEVTSGVAPFTIAGGVRCVSPQLAGVGPKCFAEAVSLARSPWHPGITAMAPAISAMAALCSQFTRQMHAVAGRKARTATIKAATISGNQRIILIYIAVHHLRSNTRLTMREDAPRSLESVDLFIEA